MISLTLTFQVSVELEFVLSFVLDAIGQAGVDEALVFAGLVVVGVVAVAVLTDHFASIFLGGHLHFAVGSDEIVHADNVLGKAASAVIAASRVSGADEELDQVLGVEKTFFTSSFLSDLDEGSARVVLDGVSVQPAGILLLVLVVLFELTGLGQKTLSHLGVSGDVEVGDDFLLGGGDTCEEGSEDGGAEQHGDMFWINFV